jgi:prolyl 4-hydroxylase
MTSTNNTAIDNTTANNDVDAMLHLAKQHLLGNGIALDPHLAFQLLNKATALGSAEAPRVLAILYALGYQCQQSWQGALESMALAAWRGSTNAQDQLLLLTANRKLAQQRSSTADYWQEVTSAIALQTWVTPPAHKDLCSTTLVRHFAGFASNEVCQWLINRAKPRLARAKVYDAVQQQETVHSTRTNSFASFELFDTDLIQVLLQQRMAACLGVPVAHFEVSTVLHYAPGEQISEHYDFIDPQAPRYHQQIAEHGQRMVTFLVYLNDNYADGETEFPRLHVCHKAQRGDGLFFVNINPDGNPNLQTLHAGRPPVGNDKWIVSQFIRNKRFFPGY